jgi:hypothetical protein
MEPAEPEIQSISGTLTLGFKMLGYILLLSSHQV